MSNLSWEEEIEQRLDTILKELKVTQDMVGTLMGGGFETPKEAKPAPKSRRRAEKKTEKPQSLDPGQFINTLKGTLLNDPVQRDVETRRGPTTVTNFVLNTDYGEIRVALWEELGDAVMNCVGGDEVTVTNLIIKDPFDNMMQVSSTKNTKVS